MDVGEVDVERFGVGRFGDARLEKRGPGVTPPWLSGPVRAFAGWAGASGAARSDLAAFCAIPR